MKDVKKNFALNIIYQILVLIIPLITIPYVSRKLGADGVGIYSYTYSIAYYFMIIAMLGLNNYGNRTIAKVRNDKEVLSKTFTEIYALQLITSAIAVFSYLAFSFLFNNDHKLITILQSFYVISCAFDINWFFFGIEKFKITVTRNAIVKFLSLVAIFIFVNDSHDVWIYTMILSLSTLVSQLLLWPFLKNEIHITKIKFRDVKKHFKPCLILFLPVVAISIYKVMDKTMLGAINSLNELGYYESAEKIIGAPLAIISALGTVMLPRMSNIYHNGEKEEAHKMIEQSIKIIMFLSFAMTFGIIGIAKDFSILFFGKSFARTGILLSMLSVTIIFQSFGNVFRTQYLIPNEQDKVYVTSVFIGALINLVSNFIFIPYFGAVGACIGTILAEFFVMFYQALKVKKELPLKEYIYSIIPFFVKSIIMFIIVVVIGMMNCNLYVKLLLQIVIAILVYCLLNYKYIYHIIKDN